MAHNLPKTYINHKLKCYFCGKPVLNYRYKYCPDCLLFAARLDGSSLSPQAKKSVETYIHQHGFVCNYTSMALDLKNPKSPWYCVFDHWVPGDDRKVVLTSFLVNDMKTEMSAAEFWDMVEALYNFKKYGTKIKKKELHYWKGFFRAVEGFGQEKRKCTICGKSFYVASSNQKYCAMCAELMWRMEVKKFPAATVKEVLDYIRQYGYVCYYTRMPLNTTNPRNPWYVVLDHWMPGDPAKLVVTSALFNAMKSDLTEEEFWDFIEQLYNYRKNGIEVVKKDPIHWNRLYPSYL